MCPRICVKKFWLINLIALIVILACTSVSASDALEKAGFHFMRYYVQQNNLNGTGYYILSESEFDHSANGDVIILGGNAVFRGNITGNIFVAYSDVVFEEGANINGDVVFLSSKISFKNGVTHIGETKQATRLLRFLLRHYELQDSVVYNDSQPYYFIFVLFGVIQMAVGFVVLLFMKNFLSQGAVVFMKQTRSVLIKGVTLYFILGALIIIFLWSVIGFPIALLLCFIYIIMVYLGQVSLAIAIGLAANIKLMKKNNVYLFFVAGTLFIELVKLLPFVNIVINFVVLPVICFGVVAATSINAKVLRVYFSMPFLHKIDKRDLRNNQFRDIILKDINTN